MLFTVIGLGVMYLLKEILSYSNQMGAKEIILALNSDLGDES